MHTFLYITLLLFCTTTTWNLLVTRFMDEMSDLFLFAVFFFSLALIFSLVAPSIPHLPIAAMKFLLFFFRRNSSPLFIISRSSSSSVIMSLHTLKFIPKKGSALLFFLPPQVTGYRGGRTYVRTILPEAKFLGCIDSQIFLPMVPRCGLYTRARTQL